MNKRNKSDEQAQAQQKWRTGTRESTNELSWGNQQAHLTFVLDDYNVSVQAQCLPSTLAFTSTGTIYQPCKSHDHDYAIDAENGNIMAKPPWIDYGFVAHSATENTTAQVTVSLQRQTTCYNSTHHSI